MDREKGIAEEKANSLFQVDGKFLKKILARKSFAGQSMRMFQSESVVSVPFDWEMQPGTPKHPQSEIVTPVKPPPSLHSQSLGKPSFASSAHTSMSCFWKKSRKKAKPNGRQGQYFHDNINATDSLEFSDVNDIVDSTSSSDHSRSSSSSSSISNSSSNSTSNTSSSSSSSRSFAKGLIKWSF